MPGKDPGGIIVTSLIGVAGSLIATYAGRALGWYRRTDRGLHYVGDRGDCVAGRLSLG